MTKFGETDDFTGHDFVRMLEVYIERQVDGIICNTAEPDDKLLEQYREQKAKFVETDDSDKWWGNRKIYASDMLDTADGIVRHDSKKLALLIEEVICQKKE